MYLLPTNVIFVNIYLMKIEVLLLLQVLLLTRYFIQANLSEISQKILNLKDK